MILTKTQLLRKNHNIEQPPLDFANIQSFHLDQPKAQQWLDDFIVVMDILLFPMILIGLYTYRLVQALLYALIGLILNAIFQANLVYGQLLKLSIIAIIPAIVIDLVCDTLGYMQIHIPISGWIYFFISIAYLAFGIHASKMPPAPRQMPPSLDALPPPLDDDQHQA
jgi:hypothetical protein